MARYYSDQTSLNNISAAVNKLIIIINCLILKKTKKKTGKTAVGGTRNNKIMVPLKYSSNFQRTLEKCL